MDQGSGQRLGVREQQRAVTCQIWERRGGEEAEVEKFHGDVQLGTFDYVIGLLARYG